MEADTVTISKDYLKQLLCQRIQSSEEQPNEDSTHIVLDHTQIPGLEKHSVTISDNDIEQHRMEELVQCTNFTVFTKDCRKLSLRYIKSSSSSSNEKQYSIWKCHRLQSTQ